MLRFSLTTLSVMAAGLLQVVPGLVTDACADDSVIWIEPVPRDYTQMWKKKAAASRKNEQPSSDAPENWKRSGRQEGARGASYVSPKNEASPAAPKDEDAKKAERRKSMGHSMMRMRKANVRAGVFPSATAGLSGPYLSQTRFWLELPDNSLLPVKLQKKKGRYRVQYPYKTGGDYRLISYNGNHVQNGVRQHLYAYYSFMAHGDRPDKKQRDQAFRPGFQDGNPKLELIRFYDRHRHRYRSRAGHRLHVRVLYKGKPVANAPVTLTTSKDWRKRLETNEKGEASFTLIKEDFQRGILNKRKSTLFMLQTEHKENTPGDVYGRGYNSEQYFATLSFRVFPDNNEWEDRHIAFLVVIFTIVVVGTAIVIYRTRRRKKA
jgi:UPF0716 family protein affecting phage T7 exclusion